MLSKLKQLVPAGGRAYLAELRSRAIIAGHPETRKLVAKGFRFPAADDAAHIELALNWFQWATSASADGGVPHSVNIRHFASKVPKGIAPSYPETSGYILCTLVYGLRSDLPTLAKP